LRLIRGDFIAPRRIDEDMHFNEDKKWK